MITDIDARLLEKIADLTGQPVGAFNIRKDGQLVERHSSANIEISTKTDEPGIDKGQVPGFGLTDNVHMRIRYKFILSWNKLNTFINLRHTALLYIYSSCNPTIICKTRFGYKNCIYCNTSIWFL